MPRDSGLGPEGLDQVCAPADAWTPADDQRCCGTCQHLRELRGAQGCVALACHLEPGRYLGARWWGSTCGQWTGPQSIPVECVHGCESCADCAGNTERPA